MKILSRILLVYKSILPFAAFLILALLIPQKTALLAATGWICAILFITIFISRFVANKLSISVLIWEILSILFIVTSIILRDYGNFETYFIEVTLIDFASIVIGLLFFQIYKMTGEKKGEGKTSAIVIIAVIVGVPLYILSRNLILGWFELNTITQDPTPFVLLLMAVLSSIIREIRFFQSLIKGKANYQMNFLENNKWIAVLVLVGWIVLVPLVAWLIR